MNSNKETRCIFIEDVFNKVGLKQKGTKSYFKKRGGIGFRDTMS